MGHRFSLFRAARGKCEKVLLTLGLMHGAGDLLVGIFHGGQPAFNAFPLHAIGAILAIVGGNLASIYFPVAGSSLSLSRAIRVTSVGLGVMGLACLLMLGVSIRMGSFMFPDGVWERGSVYAITAWELLIAARLVGSYLATVLKTDR